MFLGKGVLKLCSKFTGEYPCRSVISIKMQSNFIEITLRHRCYPVNLLHIFRACFPEYTSGRLLLKLYNVTPKFLLFLVFSCYNRHCLKIYSKAPIEECLKEMIVRIIEFKSIADLKNRYQI